MRLFNNCSSAKLIYSLLLLAALAFASIDATQAQSSAKKPVIKDLTKADDNGGDIGASLKLANLMKITLTPKDFAQEAHFSGKMVNLTTKAYYWEGGLAGGRNIRVDCKMTNQTKFNATWAVHVAFFNGDGALISAGGSSGGPILPGKDQQIEINTTVPQGYEREIKFYQVSLYDTPKKQFGGD
jgi:hypothetical protein